MDIRGIQTNQGPAVFQRLGRPSGVLENPGDGPQGFLIRLEHTQGLGVQFESLFGLPRPLMRPGHGPDNLQIDRIPPSQLPQNIQGFGEPLLFTEDERKVEGRGGHVRIETERQAVGLPGLIEGIVLPEAIPEVVGFGRLLLSACPGSASRGHERQGGEDGEP